MDHKIPYSATHGLRLLKDAQVNLIFFKFKLNSFCFCFFIVLKIVFKKPGFHLSKIGYRDIIIAKLNDDLFYSTGH